MAKPAAKKKHPSKEQVRAWLGTVIGPMTDALQVEVDRLSTRSLSFRAGLRDFEFLWPTRRMIAAPFLQNRSQYFRAEPNIRHKCDKHDQLLEVLRESCRWGFDALLSNSEFLRLCEEGSIDQVNREYLAEYIVNGVNDLPGNYVHHKLWSTRGGELLALRELKDLKALFVGIERESVLMQRAANELLEALRDRQLDLADEFGLPAVDPDARGLA